MLTRHPADTTATTIWYDLLDPTADEISTVEAATGLTVPRRDALVEIETSSRLRLVADVLYLSTPMVWRGPAPATTAATPVSSPLGFVLAPKTLITIRFAPLGAFATYADAFATAPAGDAAAAFVGLAEAIVGRIADVLENVGHELDTISSRIFSNQVREVVKVRRPNREDADLRAILRRIGRSGDLASKLRDSLLGIGRIAPYVLTMRNDALPVDLRRRLDALRQDIAALADYDAHLTNKVQLLMDATLGLIGVEQNNIVKVLTVVSIAGIPPTLIAGIYGMNFKNIPEYDWSYGYYYGLAMIVLSTILPLIWLKWRGWF